MLVVTEDGDFKGIMNPGGKPIHILPPEDARKIPEIADFFVDIGLGEKTADKVKVGDYVVMDEPFFEMGDKIVSRRSTTASPAGSASRPCAARQVGGDNPYEIHVVFTAQEEVGLRGAKRRRMRSRPISASASTQRLPATRPACRA